MSLDRAISVISTRVWILNGIDIIEVLSRHGTYLIPHESFIHSDIKKWLFACHSWNVKAAGVNMKIRLYLPIVPLSSFWLLSMSLISSISHQLLRRGVMLKICETLSFIVCRSVVMRIIQKWSLSADERVLSSIGKLSLKVSEALFDLVLLNTRLVIRDVSNFSCWRYATFRETPARLLCWHVHCCVYLLPRSSPMTWDEMGRFLILLLPYVVSHGSKYFSLKPELLISCRSLLRITLTNFFQKWLLKMILNSLRIINLWKHMLAFVKDFKD